MNKRPILKGFTETKEDYYVAARSGKILRMGLQIDTPPCNWNCPYCYASESPSTTIIKAAPIEDIFGWINQGIDLGATGLTVNGTFEPTLSKDFFSVLEYSTESGLNTMLVTNGTGITKESAEKIKKLGVSVLIKLNVPIAKKGDIDFDEYGKVQSYMSGYSENSNIYSIILKNLKY